MIALTLQRAYESSTRRAVRTDNKTDQITQNDAGPRRSLIQHHMYLMNRLSDQKIWAPRGWRLFDKLPVYGLVALCILSVS